MTTLGQPGEFIVLKDDDDDVSFNGTLAAPIEEGERIRFKNMEIGTAQRITGNKVRALLDNCQEPVTLTFSLGQKPID